MAPDRSPILDVERIDTDRGRAHVLRGVSMTVQDGEAVCLVGRNGAGKTTTIESVMGLLPVRAGSDRPPRPGRHAPARVPAGPARDRLLAGGRRDLP